MYKYILPLLVLTSCSPLKNASLEESEEFYKNHIEFRITQQLIREINTKNKLAKYEADKCNETGKCLKKATYLVYDYYLNQYSCILAQTEKRVSCK